MGHKGETQITSNEVPGLPNTIIRNGVYYFNARYLTELVNSGAVNATHYKRSLRTKDRRTAKAKATVEAGKFMLITEELLSSLKNTSSKPHTRDTSGRARLNCRV